MMGNILSSDTDDKNESVINLSDNCVNRVTKEEKKCASSTPDKLADGEWVKKLKCMDDIHSQENGLTYQCLLDLIKRVEVQLHDLRPPVCEYEGIITCLKKNEKCMIRCKKHMDDFVNCIDAQRMNIIREKYEMEQKMNNMQQDNEITKQFFNSR